MRLLLFCAALCGCLTAWAQSNPNLAGTWEVKVPERPDPIVLVLATDGSGALDKEKLHYSARDGRLSIVQDGETHQYTFTLEGDRLTLTGGDLDQPTTFVRKGGGKGLGAKLKSAGAAGVATQPAPSNGGLVGAWEIRKDGQSLRFDFQSDGSGSMNGIPLQWKYEGTTLSLTMAGNTVGYQAVVNGTELRLSGGDLQQTVALQRTAGTTSADTRIVGRWKAENGGVIEFKPDGSGSNRRGNFRYTAMEGTLVITAGPLVVGYQIEGDRLTLSGHGDTATFTRTEAPVNSSTGTAARERRVIVNKTRLAANDVFGLERQFQVRILDGSYWYDKACGAWGIEGGPTVGWLPAGLNIGGKLQADASGGRTGVFINGRELHPLDVQGLARLTQTVIPGRYWVDAMGRCGVEGNPVPLIDLAALARASQSRGSGSTFYRNELTGIGAGSDGHTSYVMGKDFSVIVGD